MDRRAKVPGWYTQGTGTGGPGEPGQSTGEPEGGGRVPPLWLKAAVRSCRVGTVLPGEEKATLLPALGFQLPVLPSLLS